MSLTPTFAGAQWDYQTNRATTSPGFYGDAFAWLNKITFSSATTMVVNMRIGKDATPDSGEASYTGCRYNISVNGTSVTGDVSIGDASQFPTPTVTVPASGTFTLNVVLVCNVRAYSQTASVTINDTFTIYDLTGPLTFVNENTKFKILRLPSPSSWTGKIPLFVKNALNAQTTFVHSNAGEMIDGITDGYVQLYSKACIGFASSASQWYLTSYFANSGLPISATTGGTAITSACAFVDFSTTNKTVSLPNPATWGKGRMLAIAVRQAGPPNASNYTCSVVTNGYLFDTTANAVTISITNLTLTGGMLLISDGTSWYIAGMSNGSDLTYAFNAASEGRPVMTNAITFVQSGSNDGLTPPDVSSLGNSAVRIAFPKLIKNAPFANGLVLQGVNWGLGQINFNKVFKTGGINYSGFVCVFGNAPNTGASYAMHPVCTYPSVY